MADNIDELHRKIKDLEGEVAYLNAQLKQDNRFGLHWIDVPEAFEAGGENAIPILEEVPDLSITTDDGKPTHILIEGDNYHALTCLNYTHQGKVDVIYIDPPYNTGSDGFTYKDKRFLDKYPDGTQLFLTMILMPMTYSISNGILLGLVAYVILNLCTGKVKKVGWFMAALSILVILKFIFL